jgi:putative oxidoreductase
MSVGGKTSGVDLGLLVIRLGIGGLFAGFFGLHKVMGGPDQWAALGKNMGLLGIQFLPTFWGAIAAFSELLGGALLVLGLLFRPGCLLLCGVMIVATVHNFDAGKGMMGASASIIPGVAVLGLLLAGPGRFSLKSAIGPLRGRWFG